MSGTPKRIHAFSAPVTAVACWQHAAGPMAYCVSQSGSLKIFNINSSSQVRPFTTLLLWGILFIVLKVGMPIIHPHEPCYYLVPRLYARHGDVCFHSIPATVTVRQCRQCCLLMVDDANADTGCTSGQPTIVVTGLDSMQSAHQSSCSGLWQLRQQGLLPHQSPN